MIELDSKYGVKFKNLAGVLTIGADRLSRHEILKEIPSGALKQLCKVSVFYRDADDAYPILIQAIQEAEERKETTYARQSRQIKKALSLAQNISMEPKLSLIKVKVLD